jgi:hypothetical protein
MRSALKHALTGTQSSLTFWKSVMRTAIKHALRFACVERDVVQRFHVRIERRD